MAPPFEVTLLTDDGGWLAAWLPELADRLSAAGHHVRYVGRPADVPEGDVLVALSSTKLVPPPILARNRHNLVVHQSALPLGRGWSPLAWQVLAGASAIPTTLFEMAPDVDSGAIYARGVIELDGTELADELRRKQADNAFAMVEAFFAGYPATAACEVQVGEPTFYERRRAADMRLDPTKPLVEQFDLLRIADNQRYPAFFEHRGETYTLKIEKQPRLR